MRDVCYLLFCGGDTFLLSIDFSDFFYYNTIKPLVCCNGPLLISFLASAPTPLTLDSSFLPSFSSNSFPFCLLFSPPLLHLIFFLLLTPFSFFSSSSPSFLFLFFFFFGFLSLFLIYNSLLGID